MLIETLHMNALVNRLENTSLNSVTEALINTPKATIGLGCTTTKEGNNTKKNI